MNNMQPIGTAAQLPPSTAKAVAGFGHAIAKAHVELPATNKVGFVDDSPDLAPLGPRPIKQLQNNSPEAMRGDPAYVSGAEGGDFLVPRGDEIGLYKGTTGIETIFVLFEEHFLE